MYLCCLGLGPYSGIPPLAAARMQRWVSSIILAAYDYQIVFRSTTDHGNADALSRFPLEQVSSDSAGAFCHSIDLFEGANTPITFSDLRRETAMDPILSLVLQRLKEKWIDVDFVSELAPFAKRKLELSIDQNVLLWGRRVIVPSKLREKVLKLLHEDHKGLSRMKSVARSYVWWPGMDSHLDQIVKNCESCISTRNSPAKLKDATWPIPAEPWSRVHVDFAGPVRGKMLLILVDATSKWPEVVPLSTATTETTIRALRSIFAGRGIPLQLVSDNGPQFTSKEFAKFMLSNGIIHRMGAPYHPETNGLAERLVQTVKKSLGRMESEPGDLMTKINRFLLGYRNTPHSTTGQSPAILLTNRPLRSRLDLLLPTKPKEEVSADGSQPKFLIGQPILSKDFRPSGSWQQGIISKQLGKFLYEVKVGNMAMKRHVDQLLPASNRPPLKADTKLTPALMIKKEKPAIPVIQLNTQLAEHPPNLPLSTPAPVEVEPLLGSSVGPTIPLSPEVNAPAAEGPTTTRYGRVIRRPLRYRDEAEDETTGEATQ